MRIFPANRISEVRNVWQQARTWYAGAVAPAARAVADLLAPPRCTYCDTDLAAGAVSPLLCDDCRRELAPLATPRCPRCGATCGPYTDPATGCGLCRRAGLRFDAVYPLGGYTGRLRRAVLRMKRWSEETLTGVIAELMCRQLAAELRVWKPDLIVPIPMHWWRRLWRGTNSPDILARRLGQELRVPAALHRLMRRRATLPQGSLPPSRRAENMRGAFAVRHADAFKGVRVLLVDDILTTGATCSEAARVLKRAGAASVAVAVAARAQGDL